MNHDWIYLDAVKCVVDIQNKLWHWLCKNHPQIALEYKSYVEEEEE